MLLSRSSTLYGKSRMSRTNCPEVGSCKSDSAFTSPAASCATAVSACRVAMRTTAGRIRPIRLCRRLEQRLNSRRVSITQFLSEDLNHLLDRACQNVHLLFRVVESKRRTRRGWYVKSLHHRLGTMMPGTNSDALLIQNRADVVRMNVVNDKRKHTGFFACRT